MTSQFAARPRQDTIIRLRDGRMLGYAEYGDPAGAPVLAFHGFPGSRVLFALAHEQASRCGVRFIAPDRPGFGLSSFKKSRTILDWPDDVTELADALGISGFAALGVSGGGPYVAACAYRIPSRLTGAAIVSGVGPLDRPRATDGMMLTNRALFGTTRRVPPLGRAMIWLFGAIATRTGERGIDRMIKALPEADRRILARADVRECMLRDTRESFRSGARGPALEGSLVVRPWGFRLEDIVVPVHVWQGAADRNVPEAHGRYQAGAIPNATLHFFPDEGHFLVVDRIQEILTAITGGAP
jgi:pimeloyl-ACP methyl ester carboxylesterase